MNIYENNKSGRGRGASSCGYCRRTGHNINECPQVAKDYAYWKDYTIPLQAGNPCHYYNANTPKYWGEWYTKCINAMQKQLDYREKQKQPKVKRKSSPKKCGFCGETGHTRRNCDKMNTFLTDAYKANENWRRAAYDLLVKKLGLSVGAVIQVKYDGYGTYGDEKPVKVALVRAINWGQLNLACANPRWGDYRQALVIIILVEGVEHKLKFSHERKDSTMKPTFQTVGGWGHWKYVNSLAAAPEPLAESWVHDYRDAFDYLVKKRNYSRLVEEGLAQLVEDWK